LAFSIFSIVAGWPSLVSGAVDPVSNWNMIAIQASFTAGQNGITQSRTLAVVHLAIHDALNTIEQRYRRYAFAGNVSRPVSVDAAIAAAARDAIFGAVAVGAVPFAGFGTPAL